MTVQGARRLSAVTVLFAVFLGVQVYGVANGVEGYVVAYASMLLSILAGLFAWEVSGS